MFGKLFIVISIATLLSACSSPDPAWRKQGVSQHDAQSMSAQCKYDIGLNKVADSKEKEMIKNCMEAKGFRWSTH